MATAAPASTTSSLTPIILSPKPIYKYNSLSLINNPLSKQFASLSLSSTIKHNKYVKVAVSSDFGIDEDDNASGLSGESEVDDRSFSPDLKIFVGNLPFTCDSATLAGLFETAGNVEMVEVIYDKITGRSRGFGFVTMSTSEEVQSAVEQFNGYELEGRPIRVNAGPPPPREDNPFRAPRGGGGRSFDNTNRLYVGNLSWGVDNLALETLFNEQGKVMEAKVVYDRESGRSRGFGFVTYGSANEVNRAIDALNGAELDGRQIRVSVAEAPPMRRQY